MLHHECLCLQYKVLFDYSANCMYNKKICFAYSVFAIRTDTITKCIPCILEYENKWHLAQENVNISKRLY